MCLECRNNVAPTYATQPADVWSLGIVLINMLYHHNPWSDTATQCTIHPSSTFSQDPICPAFASFLSQPVPFFLSRFPGMTYPVADFLANRVFCILPNPNALLLPNTGIRVSARAFGEWIKSLPVLMAVQPERETVGRSKLGEQWEGAPANEMALTIPDLPIPKPVTPKVDLSSLKLFEEEDAEDEGPRSPSAMKKRGKRGARRKDKSQPPSTGNPSFTSMDLDDLAGAVEQIARSARSDGASSVRTTGGSRKERVLARMPPMPSKPPPAPPGQASVAEYQAIGRRISEEVPPMDAPTQVTPELKAMHPGAAAILGSEPVMRKGWLERFKKSGSGHAAPSAHASPISLPNVSVASDFPPTSAVARPVPARNLGSQWSSREEEKNDLDVPLSSKPPTWGSPPSNRWMAPSPALPESSTSPPNPDKIRAMDKSWRLSSVTNASSSASSTYTRFSNASARSVSTANTSLSGISSTRKGDEGPWRLQVTGEPGSDAPPRPRKNGGGRPNIKSESLAHFRVEYDPNSLCRARWDASRCWVLYPPDQRDHALQ